ncbi:hypothetical protein EDC04DRAFT_2718308 [Pisolithus marmoratus]|nr:hypothetical protein EDC04DRAFT_2718308 [Pisolithus marmoratus]
MFNLKNPMQGVANIVECAYASAQMAEDAARSQRIRDAAGQLGIRTRYADLVIQFIGASGIPKMDLVGSADPYFVAKLDDKLSYVSSVKPGTQSPVWNEIWKVKNVPASATLSVIVRDKDLGAAVDDYIGKFYTSVSPGPKEVEIQGPMNMRNRGTFWIKIESSTSSEDPERFPYLFDGPVHYSSHSSLSVGALANLRDTRLYRTWKIYIKGVPKIFGDQVQSWNRSHKAAQAIFEGPASIAVRSGIQAGHRMLYARTVTNGFGVISNWDAVLSLLCGGVRSASDRSKSYAHRVKPAVYTYVVSADDDTLRFSETGAAFFVDFVSKHALHSNCAENVRYSGEFHPRPVGGWENFSDDIPDDAVGWELVFDNNSGTYAPDAGLLPKVKEIMEFNFPGLNAVVHSHDEATLKESVEACRAYALSKRGVTEHELQPHVVEGEETLSHQAFGE